MKNITQYYIKLVGIILISILTIVGCDNQGTSGIGGTSGQGSAYFNGMKSAAHNNAPLDIEWSIDGYTYPGTVDMNDIAWHLLTLTVKNQDTPLPTPIAVNGLKSAIYPAPTDNKGESIQIVDINCKTAQFSKNGDTCSAYVKVTYDYIRTGTDNPPVIQAQVAPVSDDLDEALLNIKNKPLFKISIGDYRIVLPIESIGGSKVLSNINQYQILQMQNIALLPITITQITPLSNPNFALMHRTVGIESVDPYYGLESECSLSLNPSLKQTNILNRLDDSCILIYSAAASTSQTIESDIVTLATNSNTTSPWEFNTFLLVANYVQGHPIPEADKLGSDFTIAAGRAHPEGTTMVMDSPGALVSGTVAPSSYPFNLVNVSYQLSPKPLPLSADYPLVQNNIFTIAESCSNLISCTPLVNIGSSLLTDGSTTNPVTVTQTSEVVPAGSSNPGVFGDVTTNCGGSETKATMSLQASPELARRNLIHMHVDITSNTHCGNWYSTPYDEDIPVTGGYVKTIFNQDQLQCGDGGKWDNGGIITIAGFGCNTTSCGYQMDITANHNQVGGSCTTSKTQNYPVNIAIPVISQQITQMQGFTPTGQARYIGLAGQNLSAWFAGQGSVLAQTVSCSPGDIYQSCAITGLYRNGLSDTAMAYQAGLLNTGDRLWSGKVNFNRSEGYDLSDFNSSHKIQD